MQFVEPLIGGAAAFMVYLLYLARLEKWKQRIQQSGLKKCVEDRLNRFF